jgi:hypothetical protein
MYAFSPSQTAFLAVYTTSITGNACLTKIDSSVQLYVYHPFNILFPIRTTGYWIVHDELESFQKQAIIDFAKFASLNTAVDEVVIVAGGAAAPHGGLGPLNFF